MYQCICYRLVQCIMHLHTIHTDSFSAIHKRYCDIIVNPCCHFIKKVK